MAFSQQIPKENPARNNKHTTIILQRRNDDKLYGPDLPKDKAWHEETKAWYRMWRRHPIAPQLEESDWFTLKSACVLHSEFWFGTLPPTQMVSYHAEMRRVASMFGATVEDRLKLRMKFAPAEDGTPDSEKEGTPKKNSNYEALFEEEV